MAAGMSACPPPAPPAKGIPAADLTQKFAAEEVPLMKFSRKKPGKNPPQTSPKFLGGISLGEVPRKKFLWRTAGVRCARRRQHAIPIVSPSRHEKRAQRKGVEKGARLEEKRGRRETIALCQLA